MKKKVIITSALTAALMLAGAVGGTFAWFTSESNTDVNITAGKVNISSAVSELIEAGTAFGGGFTWGIGSA